MLVAVDPFQPLPNPMPPIEMARLSSVLLRKLGVVPQPLHYGAKCKWL